MAASGNGRWIARSLDEVARFFGTTGDNIRHNWRPHGMPGKPRHWPLDEIAAWRLQRFDKKRPESTALEEYRQERLKLARLDRRERERQLVRRSEIHSAMMCLATRLGQCGKQIERDFGADAREMVDDTLAEFERELAQTIDGDETTTNPPPFGSCQRI